MIVSKFWKIIFYSCAKQIDVVLPKHSSTTVQNFPSSFIYLFQTRYSFTKMYKHLIFTSFICLSISAEHVCKTRSKLLARLFHHTIHKESAVINTLLQASKFSSFPENKQLTLLQTFICRQSCPGDVYPCWKLEDELEDYIHSCYLQRSEFEQSTLFNTNFEDLFKNIQESFPQIFKFGIDDLDFSEIIKSMGERMETGQGGFTRQ